MKVKNHARLYCTSENAMKIQGHYLDNVTFRFRQEGPLSCQDICWLRLSPGRYELQDSSKSTYQIPKHSLTKRSIMQTTSRDCSMVEMGLHLPNLDFQAVIKAYLSRQNSRTYLIINQLDSSEFTIETCAIWLFICTCA